MTNEWNVLFEISHLKERFKMKDTIKKSLALGLGFAVTTKEQAEKIANELVKKGELTKQESTNFIKELIEKGEETKEDIDQKINEKVDEVLKEMNIVTEDEVEHLRKRIEKLEKALKESK